MEAPAVVCDYWLQYRVAEKEAEKERSEATSGTRRVAR